MTFLTKKITTPHIPLPPITALVFEGGGVKGLAYTGVLQTLEEKNLLKDVKWVAGSSVGAMTALMVALGYTQTEIKTELRNIDFSKFQDHDPSWFGAAGQTISGIRSLFGLKRGYYRGEKLYSWVKKIVNDKLGNEMATFNDLHAAAIENPNFKELFVTATSVNRQKTKFFSHERRGNAPIADVVLASMSIPLFFQARYMDSNYHIDWKPTRKKIKSGKLFPYVDGGFLNNDPIEIFQDRKYWPPNYWELIEGKPINPSVLNIRIDSNEEISALWGKPNNPIFTFLSWLKNLFNTALSDQNKSNEYLAVTMRIPNCNIGTTKFCLTNQEKESLIQSGRNTTLNHIAQTRDGAVYKILKEPMLTTKHLAIIGSEVEYDTLKKQPAEIPTTRVALRSHG